MVFCQLPYPHKSWSNIHVLPLPTPSVTFAQIMVTMASFAQCTPVQPVGRPHQAMWHIIVWRPNVISVIAGNIPMTSAIFRSAEDVTPRGMWLITAQSIHLSNLLLATLMEKSILMTMTSTPLWMTTRKIECIKPGA